MAKIDITKTELVWPGKYNEDGTRKEVPRVSLPFQVIETVNESRATREAQRTKGYGLFDTYEGKEGDTFEAGWRNKLIWGDNLLVMGSLLEKFAGKVDLIYIDPPFATGADFRFSTEVGDSGGVDLIKEQSAVEEKAYRDTWGQGLPSYLAMMSQRLGIARELLSETGSLFVHLDWHVSHAIKLVLDEVFGVDAFYNEIVWPRTSPQKTRRGFSQVHDVLLVYGRSAKFKWNTLLRPLSDKHLERHYQRVDSQGRRWDVAELTAPGTRQGPSGQPWRGFDVMAIGRHWGKHPDELDRLDADGRIYWPAKGGFPRLIRFLEEVTGTPIGDVWDDIPPLNMVARERNDYPTQKPEALASRIIEATTEAGDLVADFFCGSGTTLAMAEKLGRRWIGCDLGRWGVHVTRKRLLGIEKCKPFEVLNLGRYERQYWQGVTFGDAKEKPLTEQALYEYLAFILKLYGAQPIAGLSFIHGKKGKALVHIGAVDAPVTISEIDAAVDECAKLKQSDLHVLGWEWEMGLYDLMVEAAKKKSVKLLLLQIPREVMEQQATDKGDIRFFELAYLEAAIERPKKLTVEVALKDFVIPNTELIPEEVRSKVKKWSDYIDYWSVDWDFQNDTFMQGWVAYRTRKERKLPLVCDPHTYEKPGKYRILVKVIDIFGNDTSQAFDVEVK